MAGFVQAQIHPAVKQKCTNAAPNEIPQSWVFTGLLIFGTKQFGWWNQRKVESERGSNEFCKKWMDHQRTKATLPLLCVALSQAMSAMQEDTQQLLGNTHTHKYRDVQSMLSLREWDLQSQFKSYHGVLINTQDTSKLQNTHTNTPSEFCTRDLFWVLWNSCSRTSDHKSYKA